MNIQIINAHETAIKSYLHISNSSEIPQLNNRRRHVDISCNVRSRYFIIRLLDKDLQTMGEIAQKIFHIAE
jgi:hypothetical protein